jgi:hypothetical protein
MSTSRRWLGVIILAALFAHILVKVRDGVLSEVLWSCHVASFALGVGLVIGSWRLAAPGILYHIGMGMPAYLLDLSAGADTNPTGVATHVASLFLGLAAARGMPVPRRVIAETWIAYASLLPITALLANPALNVNQVVKPWLSLGGIYDYKVVYLSLNLLIAGLDLALTREVWMWLRQRRQVAVAS